MGREKRHRRVIRRPGGDRWLCLILLVGLIVSGGAIGVPAGASEADLVDVNSTAVVERENGRTKLKVHVEGVVEHTVDRVREVLLDLESYPNWFPALREWRVLSSAGQSKDVYGQQGLPWPWKPRDYVVRYAWRDLPEGGFALEATALDHTDAVATEADVVRLTSMRTVWVVKPQAGKTRASYDYAGDPQIEIPDWLATQAWQRHTNEIIRALHREVDRRSAQSIGPMN